MSAYLFNNPVNLLPSDFTMSRKSFSVHFRNVLLLSIHLCLPRLRPPILVPSNSELYLTLCPSYFRSSPFLRPYGTNSCLVYCLSSFSYVIIALAVFWLFPPPVISLNSFFYFLMLRILQILSLLAMYIYMHTFKK